MSARWGERLRSRSTIDAMVALGTSVLLLGPALGPGYVLSYDMVFVPRMPFTARLLGIDGSVPRAVPSDALVALASRVVDSATLQKVILLAVLVAAGTGAARLVRRCGRAASAVAVVFAVWNPYVASRLWLGQWAILVAYAVLPWLVLAAARLRRGDRRRAALVVVLLALAALTASGGLLAAATALCVVAFAAHDWSDRWRQLMLVLVASIVVNLPWLLPAVLRRAAWPADPQAFDAFAARADTPLGTIGSVVTLGGTWNAQVMPAGRDSWWTATLVLLIGVVALLGVWVTISDRPRPAWAVGLAVAAAGSTAAALAASVPVSARLLQELAVHLPGLALLRDGTRYLPPLVLLTVVGLATGARWLADRIEPRTLAPVVMTFALLAPLVALIGAAWGEFGALRTVDYPYGWTQARAAVAGEPDHGAVVSLPWGAYRRYAWNNDRTVYDPATRWLPASVITDDRLRVGNLVLPGEDPRAAAVTALLDSADDQPLADALAKQGVGWVLVTGETGVADPPAVWFDGMTEVVDTAELQLWQVPDPVPVDTSIRAARLVVIVDIAVAVLVVVCVVVACRPNRAARTGGAASMTTQPSSGPVKESPP